ncbi:MAG TPA: TIM barrel protein [Acidobacteriota bacterium]|jgi:hydroxypyruvate isomerase
MKEQDWDRRSVLKTVAGGAAASMALPYLSAAEVQTAKGRGNINHSVCKWCYDRKLSLDELAAGAAKIGLKSVELIGPEEFAVVRKYGLTCAMTWGIPGIPDNLNRLENHDRCEATAKKNIDFAAEAGIPSVIVFSGNRKGMSDEEGLENCAVGVKRFIGHAEQKNINVAIELLNSKVNHKDYMCDKTDWGVRLVKKVGSPRFKLLYDIYHMQIMEGDVIRTIRENKDYFVHYHTGGNPGRNEIDETQELNYAAISKAILDTGYTGFIGQEFIPTRDPLTSLAQAFRICDV